MAASGRWCPAPTWGRTHESIEPSVWDHSRIADGYLGVRILFRRRWLRQPDDLAPAPELCPRRATCGSWDPRTPPAHWQFTRPTAASDIPLCYSARGCQEFVNL